MSGWILIPCWWLWFGGDIDSAVSGHREWCRRVDFCFLRLYIIVIKFVFCYTQGWFVEQQALLCPGLADQQQGRLFL